MRRIVMACAAGAALVVGACASETTEPKTPAQAEQDSAEFDDGSGLSDEEFWAREEAKDAAEQNAAEKEAAESGEASYASDEEGAAEEDSEDDG